MTLVLAADVRNFLPSYNFSDDQLTVTMRVVAGWLREDTGLTELPDPIPDTHALWAPAVELVALVASNPDLLASKTVGPTSRSWPLARRRDAIRAGVKAVYVGAAAAPRGYFPPPTSWPDPTRLSQTDESWIYKASTT